jgi:hypothetical protein
MGADASERVLARQLRAGRRILESAEPLAALAHRPLPEELERIRWFALARREDDQTSRRSSRPRPVKSPLSNPKTPTSRPPTARPRPRSRPMPEGFPQGVTPKST